MTWRSVLYRYASPMRLHGLLGRVWRPLLRAALAFAVPGLWLGFVATPADAVQGEAYRLLYLHVPAAWMSMTSYAALALWSLVGLAWRTRAAHLLAHAIAPTAAWMAFLSLALGALWGRPTWGTWWVWDARLTSALLLWLLALGYLALLQAHDGEESADRPCALLALLGALNLPVLYFSVQWWNTLHQGATISPQRASIGASMLAALVLMTLAAWCYVLATVARRAQALIERRESGRLARRAARAPRAAIPLPGTQGEPAYPSDGVRHA